MDSKNYWSDIIYWTDIIDCPAFCPDFQNLRQDTLEEFYSEERYQYIASVIKAAFNGMTPENVHSWRRAIALIMWADWYKPEDTEFLQTIIRDEASTAPLPESLEKTRAFFREHFGFSLEDYLDKQSNCLKIARTLENVRRLVSNYLPEDIARLEHARTDRENRVNDAENRVDPDHLYETANAFLEILGNISDCMHKLKRADEVCEKWEPTEYLFLKQKSAARFFDTHPDMTEAIVRVHWLLNECPGSFYSDFQEKMERNVNAYVEGIHEGFFQKVFESGSNFVLLHRSVRKALFGSVRQFSDQPNEAASHRLSFPISPDFPVEREVIFPGFPNLMRYLPDDYVFKGTDLTHARLAWWHQIWQEEFDECLDFALFIRLFAYAKKAEADSRTRPIPRMPQTPE